MKDFYEDSRRRKSDRGKNFINQNIYLSTYHRLYYVNYFRNKFANNAGVSQKRVSMSKMERHRSW